MGASVTEGVFASPGKTYPEQLQTLLGSEYSVHNLGESGRTVQKDGTDCSIRKTPTDYRLSQKYEEARELPLDVVIMQFGDNDGKRCNWDEARFARDYRELIEDFTTAASRPQVYLMVPPPLYARDGVYAGMNKTVSNQLLPRALREIAAGAGDPPAIIDVYAAFLEHCPNQNDDVSCDWMYSDAVYPNDRGYAQIALAVQNEI